jgi:hypothetical protein
MALVQSKPILAPDAAAAQEVRQAMTGMANAVRYQADTVVVAARRVGKAKLAAALGEADAAELAVVWPKVKALLVALGQVSKDLPA